MPKATHAQGRLGCWAATGQQCCCCACGSCCFAWSWHHCKVVYSIFGPRLCLVGVGGWGVGAHNDLPIEALPPPNVQHLRRSEDGDRSTLQDIDETSAHKLNFYIYPLRRCLFWILSRKSDLGREHLTQSLSGLSKSFIGENTITASTEAGGAS